MFTYNKQIARERLAEYRERCELNQYNALKLEPFPNTSYLFKSFNVLNFTRRINEDGYVYYATGSYPCTLFGRQLVLKIVDELLDD